MSRRGRYAADRELTTRMLVVVFLLGLLYVVAVGALIGLGVSPFAVLLVVGGFFVFQYVASDKVALRPAASRSTKGAAARRPASGRSFTQ